MAYNAMFEYVVITRIIETGDIRTAVKRRLTADYFFLPDTRGAYAFLVDHFSQYGCTPSLERFRDAYPLFTMHTTSDPVEALVDHVRTNKLNRDLAVTLEEAVRSAREDPHEALATLRAAVSGLTAQFVLSRDIDITKTIEEAKAEYLRVKAGHGQLGIPWPWPKLTQVTLGIQDEELIFFMARPKSMKTWFLIKTAVHAHQHGWRPLFVTHEMPTAQIRRRAHAVFAQVDYEAVRSGKLTQAEEKAYFEDLEAFAEMTPFVLTGDDENKGGGVLSLASKIKEYKPDIVFVDGVYLMHDDRGGKRASDWQSIAHITQDLKRLARTEQVPIVGTTQANRAAERTKGTSMSEAAFSDSFGQDCDYMIRVIHDKPQIENNEAIMTLPGIREARGCTFTVNALVATDLSQKFVADDQEEQDQLLAGTDEGIIRMFWLPLMTTTLYYCLCHLPAILGV